MRTAVEQGKRWGRSLGHGVADLVFPPRCAGCDAELPPRAACPLLCAKCLADIIPGEVRRCPRCAARTSIGHTADDCPECSRFELRFDAALTLGNYDGLIRDFVLRMKHQQHEALTLAMASLLEREFAEQLAAWQSDLVVPCPCIGGGACNGGPTAPT
jgi:predicted amidophosphoribosyltransferase